MKKLFIVLSIIFTGLIFAPELGVSSPGEVKTSPVLPVVKQTTGRAEVTKKFLTVKATAYGPPLFPAGSLTATGESVGWGVVAVDPEVIPLGSIVSLPGCFGEKKFRALDTGKKIRGARIDVWLPSVDAVQEWGRRKVVVIIESASH